jgi:hypothetical protein
MLRIVLMVLFFYSMVVQAQPTKGSEHISTVYKLDPVIYDVKGMGNWKKGRQVGQVRLVITRTHRRDDVFLQWIQWNKKGPEKIKSTVQITEVQQMANFKTTFIRREKDKKHRQIVLGLENQHDKTLSRAIIQVQDVGLYTCHFE